MKNKKRIWNEPCIVPNPDSGPSKIEAIFYGNLTEINGEWYCDVVLVDDNINNARVIQVKYKELDFINDEDDKKWSYFVDIEKEKIDDRQKIINFEDFQKKITEIKNGDHKKVIVELPLCLS